MVEPIEWRDKKVPKLKTSILILTLWIWACRAKNHINRQISTFWTGTPVHLRSNFGTKVNIDANSRNAAKLMKEKINFGAGFEQWVSVWLSGPGSVVFVIIYFVVADFLGKFECCCRLFWFCFHSATNCFWFFSTNYTVASSFGTELTAPALIYCSEGCKCGCLVRVVLAFLYFWYLEDCAWTKLLHEWVALLLELILFLSSFPSKPVLGLVPYSSKTPASSGVLGGITLSNNRINSFGIKDAM